RPPRDLALGRRAHGGDDGGFAFLRELDGVAAQRARARRAEHGRALRDAREHDRPLGRSVGLGVAAGRVPVVVAGQRDGLSRAPGRKVEVSRVAAKELRPLLVTIAEGWIGERGDDTGELADRAVGVRVGRSLFAPFDVFEYAGRLTAANLDIGNLRDGLARAE